MFKAATDLFGRLSPSKRKKARRDLSSEMLSDDEQEDVDATTKTNFSEGDKLFLMEMTKVMAVHTETVVKPVKDALEELRQENTALKAEVTALKAGTTATDVDKIVELVVARMPQPPPGLNRSDDAVSATQLSSTTASQHDPLCWVIGALGKDLPREEAQDRARAVLEAAGIEQTKILDIYAPFAFGSLCHVIPESVSVALQIQRAVRNLRKDLGHTNIEGARIPVWFDKKRTKEERKPYLTLSTLFRFSKQLLVNKDVKASGYVKCGASRHIYYESRAQVLCHLNRENEVIFGAWGTSTFKQEELDKVLEKLRELLQ